MTQCTECYGDGWVYVSKGGQGGLVKDCPKCSKIRRGNVKTLQIILEEIKKEIGI